MKHIADQKNIASIKYCVELKYIGNILILFLTLSCKSLNISDTHFYFVQIADTHFNEPGSRERIERVIEAVNNLPMKIECVVHTGDITQEKFEVDSIITEIKGLLQQFNMPVFTLPGNHDIVWSDYDVNKLSYLHHFNELIYSVEINGVILIMFYSGPLAESINDKSYYPLVELEKLLKRYEDNPIIIFHHTPSIEDFYNNEMHDGWDADVRSAWITLLNKSDIKGVIAGHFHRDEHHWLGEIPLYISAPVSSYWGRQLTYRIYEYQNGKISYRTQYIE